MGLYSFVGGGKGKSFRYLTLAAGASLTLVSCSKPATTDPSASAAGRGRGDVAVPVSTARVAEKPMPLDVTAVGTAEPYSTVEIRAQVTGQLLSVEFAEGADVTKGQLLFTIDPRPFEVALRQAEAARDKDMAT